MSDSTLSESIIDFYVWVHRDVLFHEREIYGPLDFLGDIGGLADALLAIGTWFLMFFELITGSELIHFLLNEIFFLDNSEKQRGKPYAK